MSDTRTAYGYPPAEAVTRKETKSRKFLRLSAFSSSGSATAATHLSMARSGNLERQQASQNLPVKSPVHTAVTSV